MNCAPVEQDLTAVYCGLCLIVGIIVGRWLTYVETPPEDD